MGESGAEQSSLARNTFVGRERELAELVSACESGADSDAHLFLISGEPGIGKTRLADELASRAKVRGMQVLWGRCWEGDGAPAYWPWIQVIRTYLDALGPERRRILASESQDAAGIMDQVAQIIPDLRPAPASLQPPVTGPLDPEETRFRLFDALTNFLKIGARSRPMLVILDDLHDADEATRALLRFMARDLRGASILLVATYRELEVQRSPSLSKTIGELSRDARSIPIGGLNPSEVTKFVELRAGRKPDEMLVAKLCAATNGNPLFVDGIVRNLIAEGAIESAGAADRPFKLPSGVREAVRGRLDRLSPEANALLAVAAAIGNEFEFNLCQMAAEVPAAETRKLLDEASSAGIVTAQGSGRLRFSHALIRSAVYDELDSSRRLTIHRKIGERMEEIYRADVDAHLAELAHHFREAGVVEKAIDYSVRAGKAAASVFAYNDSLMHLQAGLELMERNDLDALRRANLLRSLGMTAFYVDRAKAVEYGESAIALYESLGHSDRAAAVRTHVGMIFHMRGEPQTNAALATDHLRRAELALARGPKTAGLVFLYNVISANEFAKLNYVESENAARRAIEISESVSGDMLDWRQWAAANYAWCLGMKGQLREGFALLDRAFEALLKAKITGFTVAWRAGFFSRLLGDPRGAQLWFKRELQRIREDTSPLGFNFLSTWVGLSRFEEGQVPDPKGEFAFENSARRSWIAGQWEVAAKLMRDQIETCDQKDNQTFALNECIFAGLTHLYIGERSRAESFFRYGLDDERGPVLLLEIRARPRLAQLYVETNRLDDAIEQLTRCQEITAGGEDWRGLAGGVARAHAIVESARGNYDIADQQFETALTTHRKYHLVWEQAETLQFWGRALAAAGDLTRADEKFDAAIDIYHSIGAAQRFVDYVTADKVKPPVTPSVAGFGPATFRREGEFWTIAFGGATFRLKNAKGLYYIAYLLARPRQRFHVHDLIEAVEGSAANGKSTIHAESDDLEIVREIDGPGPIIDARARSEYRARLRDLQIDLDEAERMNDLGRSEGLRSEIEMLGQQLIGSSGLGGHGRKVAVSAERARGMVGKNIRSALDKIRDQHPALGRHFAAAISTGYFCSYQPDPDHPISWQL